MRQCIFSLRELVGFSEVLQVTEQMDFVKNITEFLKKLLEDRTREEYDMATSACNSMNPLDPTSPSTAEMMMTTYVPNLERDWALLLETVEIHSDGMALENFFERKRKYSLYQEKLNRMFAKGIFYVLCHFRRYRAIKRLRNQADYDYNFEELFSIACTIYVGNGWGNSHDFKRMLSM